MRDHLSEDAQAATEKLAQSELRRPPPWNPVVETWDAYVARLAVDYRPQQEAAWQTALARAAAAHVEEPNA